MNINCVLCKASTDEELRVGAYILRRCENPTCRHVFVGNPPDSEALSELYASEDYIRAHSGGRQLLQDFLTVPERVLHGYAGRLRDLREHVGDSKGLKVLEIGSSTGVFLRVLKDQGAFGVGYEMSEELAQLGSRELGIQIESDFQNVRLCGPYGLVLAYAVLEHTPDPQESLLQWLDLLEPGGMILIDVPNYRSIYRKLFRNNWMWLIPPFHLQYFSPSSMRRLLDEHELVDINISTGLRSSRLYIAMHHLQGLLRNPVGSASYQGPRARYLVIRVAEFFLRLALAPIEYVGTVAGRGSRLIVTARKAPPRSL